MELVGSGKCRPRLRGDVPLLLQIPHPQGLPVSPAASCRSWKTLQRPKSSSILFLTRRILPASVLHPRGQRLLLRGTANPAGPLARATSAGPGCRTGFMHHGLFCAFFCQEKEPAAWRAGCGEAELAPHGRFAPTWGFLAVHGGRNVPEGRGALEPM